MKIILSGLMFMVIASAAAQASCCSMASNDKKAQSCSAACSSGEAKKQLACKLTSPELQQRKATVLQSLKKQLLEKRELADGFAYKFNGSDKMVDELAEFIKTERECCDFFTFSLSVSGNKSQAWLEMTGPEGSKDFITSELGL